MEQWGRRKFKMNEAVRAEMKAGGSREPAPHVLPCTLSPFITGTGSAPRVLREHQKQRPEG